MGWQTTPHVVVLLGSAVVCPLPVGYAVWYTDRYGFDRTVLSFGVLLAGMAVYSFARGIQLGHTGRAEKLLWARLLYLGFAPGVAAWFVFSVEYNSTSDRESGELVMFRDVTERKRREKVRKRKNERLEQFAGIVSHDLRNPLNVATARLDLARRETDAEIEHLGDVDESLQRMESIIDETLTLARHGQTVADPEPVDLASLAERSWAGVDTAERSPVIDDSRRIEADPERLRRVFENLFRNAVEHGSTTPRSHAPEDALEHGSDGITVRVGTLPEGFYVEDDGPGIDPSIRDELFDPGVTTAPDGTGVGLTIVSDVLAAHGWEIAATDGADGGARFEITGVEFVRE